MKDTRILGAISLEIASVIGFMVSSVDILKIN